MLPLVPNASHAGEPEVIAAPAPPAQSGCLQRLPAELLLPVGDSLLLGYSVEDLELRQPFVLIKDER